MSSQSGVSHGLSPVCRSSTCTCTTLWPPDSAASRGLVASPCAAYQTALGSVRRCNKPAAPLEASVAYSAIAFSRALLSTLVQLVQWQLGGHFPALRASLICLRFFRHPAQVRSKPFDLFRMSCPWPFWAVVRLRRCHLPDLPPQCTSSAPVRLRLSPHDITAKPRFPARCLA